MTAETASHAAMADLMRRFNDVFQTHDPATLPGLVAAECVVENSSPAPNGSRHVGRDACVALWTRIATMPGTRFDLEGTDVLDGERALIFWRFRWGDDDASSVRGVNVMTAQEGRIVHARGYVKGA